MFLSAAAVVVLTFGVAACGEDAKIAAQVDAANVGEANIRGGVAATDQNAQSLADQDQVAAEQARKRRKELADLEKDQQAETDRLLKNGSPGGNDEDSTIPIGSADPAVEKFRAKLAGICTGGQESLTRVSKQATAATKSKDPTKILAVAQAYASAINNFLGALDALDAPEGMKTDYKDWLQTINDLATNVRLQLVSQGDAKKSQSLAAKTTELTSQLVSQSAALGVTCLTTI